MSPAIWFNPDDGIKLGLKNTILVNNFERNPFTTKHLITGYYYFATNGYELNYAGEFANIFDRLNLGVDANFNSKNFAQNFFGFGNNTPNPEATKDDPDLDFNRVKIGQFNLGTFLKWRGDLGAMIKLVINYKSYDVERTQGRFLETQYNASNRLFDQQQFFNTEISYNYEHSDNPAFPTLGMGFDTKFGYTSNLNESRSFGYNITSLSVTHKLIPNGKLVLGTKLRGHFNFGNDFEFYQAASIGGRRGGLRGYRNQRFTGKNSFYQMTDIRWNMSKFKTGLLPLNLGIYGGFDYGKVWGTPNSLLNPAFNSSTPNTSYGGGVFFNAANMFSGGIGYFKSDDGTRFTFNVGFDF